MLGYPLIGICRVLPGRTMAAGYAAGKTKNSLMVPCAMRLANGQ